MSSSVGTGKSPSARCCSETNRIDPQFPTGASERTAENPTRFNAAVSSQASEEIITESGLSMEPDAEMLLAENSRLSNQNMEFSAANKELKTINSSLANENAALQAVIERLELQLEKKADLRFSTLQQETPPSRRIRSGSPPDLITAFLNRNISKPSMLKKRVSLRRQDSDEHPANEDWEDCANSSMTHNRSNNAPSLVRQSNSSFDFVSKFLNRNISKPCMSKRGSLISLQRQDSERTAPFEDWDDCDEDHDERVDETMLNSGPNPFLQLFGEEKNRIMLMANNETEA